MNNNNELCSICHENLENELHTLPECNHIFHTNCIITWFRTCTGTNKCPLCNNNGINTIKDVENSRWFDRKIAMENYHTLRIFSRKENAPKDLKQKVEKLKKMEENFKNFKEDYKEFMNTTHTDLTAKQIITKSRTNSIKNWRLYNKIITQKELIGFSQPIINIIIPVKQEI